MFAVPEEVGDAKGLFDLLEEDLDAPAAFVECAHTAGRPCGVVGDEDHDGFLAIEFDEHFHPPDGVGVLVEAFGGFEQDEVVAQDLPSGLFEELLFDGVGHVVFRAGDPVDAAPVEGEEVEEIDVSLVKQSGFAFLEIGAELLGAGVVVVAGFLDDGAGGQEGLQVETKVELGGGFAAAVFGPAHAIGDERDGAGVDGANGLLETPGKSFVTAPEMGGGVLEVFEDFPEEFLHHVAVTGLVGMGECVFRGRRGTADGGKLRGVVRETVADVVESDGMGELGVEQGDDVTPRAEGAGLLVDAILAGDFRNEVLGNELAKLAQYDGVALGWLFVFHQG